MDPLAQRALVVPADRVGVQIFAVCDRLAQLDLPLPVRLDRLVEIEVGAVAFGLAGAGILAALAVEVMSDGLTKLFPALGH